MDTTAIRGTWSVTDEALADAARRGDREAFTVLIERYRDLAVAFAFSLLRSREDAEDIAQEAFVRAYRALDTYDPSRPWGAWMMRIVRNLCRDAHRRRQVRPSETGLDPRHPADHRTPEAEVLESERARRIREAVEHLPESLRVPVILHYASGQTYREIAVALGVRESTVVGRLAGALRRLRRRLATEPAP